MAYVERHENRTRDSSEQSPNKPKALRSRLLLWASVTLVATVFCAVAGWKAYTMGQQISCGVNLSHAWHTVITQYRAEEPDNKYPPMSATPGHLFIDFSKVYPTYVGENGLTYFCGVSAGAFKNLPLEEKFAHSTYVYFGYTLQNEDEILAFLDAYPGFIEEGVDFTNDLPAPKGRGSFGGDQFVRLDQSHRPDGAAVAPSIPILIEIPNYTENGLDFRHPKPGGYVSFLGGGAPFVEFGDQFPMTPAIMKKIGAIKARYRR